jgi:glycerophosphoryl diester phosphodiesterase
VAHRAGNRLADLHAAEQAGTTLVEADVRLYRGRLEVRHLKSAGPLPVLWDRWEIAPTWRDRLSLGSLLGATGEQTELMLDLKGPRRRLAELVVDTLRPYLDTRRVTVCARWWRLLEPFADLPVRCIHSVGTRRQLGRIVAHGGDRRLDGVAVHSRLLDEGVVAELRRVADVVMTWPVNTPERAGELLRLGVDGLISDAVDAITPTLVAETRA